MGDASSMESQISLQNERHLHHPYVCEDQTSPVAHSTNEEENHKRQYKTENEDRHLLKLKLNEMQINVLWISCMESYFYSK